MGLQADLGELHIIVERQLGQPVDLELLELTVEQEQGGMGLPADLGELHITCLLYTSPSPRDRQKSRMPSSA